jgi:PrtD family type I secretion system ABC transporter
MRSRVRDIIVGGTWPAVAIVAVFTLALNLLALTLPLYTMQVYDRVLRSSHVETLIFLTLIAMVALLVSMFLETFRVNLLTRVGEWVEERLLAPVLRASLEARLSQASASEPPADLMTDLRHVRGFFGSSAVPTFADAPTVPLFILVLWLIHPQLGQVAAGAAILALAIAWANDRFTRHASEEANLAQRRLSETIAEARRSADAVKAMGLEAGLIQRATVQDAGVLKATRRVSDRQAWLGGLAKFVRLGVQVAIMFVGARLVMAGEISGGALFAAVILLGRALAPVDQSITAWRSWQSFREGYQSLIKHIDKLPDPVAQPRLPRPEGYLDVANLHAGTRHDGRPILMGVGFAARPGEAIAVIGPSGAGKSTLCRVLVGALPPRDGHVRLDGAEIHRWPDDQRGSIAYVPQDFQLISGTVAETISRFNVADGEGVIAAARLADCHDLIMRLPDGYATRLGVEGAPLSTGQRQRLALARALYGDPRLVVLDEPNAALDAEGEAALANTIAALKQKGATIIFTSHRESLVRHADRIIGLREGRVVANQPMASFASGAPSQASAQSAGAPRGNLRPLRPAEPTPEPAV